MTASRSAVGGEHERILNEPLVDESKTDADDMVKVPTTRAQRAAAELRWARDESHSMCFAGPFEPSWNPLYWLLILLIMACVLPGRWVHVPFGQGGPVRPDEAPTERIARIRWVYATDGPFALTALAGAVQLLSSYDWAVAFGLVLEVAYILGNIVFLHAMRKRNALQVRIGIVANNAFAIGMAILLVDWVVANWHERHWGHRAWTLIYRTVLVLFYLCVSIEYAPLWKEYELLPDSGEDAPLNVVAALANVSAAIVVLALLFTAAWDPSAEKVVFDAYLS
mmetsp:Transcript_25067/g.75253  ORF Transcript_25067/g.75253 Transcript_25067/m.75253 type:complete len:281 (+) Transcript_25067:146-988(+)